MIRDSYRDISFKRQSPLFHSVSQCQRCPLVSAVQPNVQKNIGYFIIWSGVKRNWMFQVKALHPEVITNSTTNFWQSFSAGQVQFCLFFYKYSETPNDSTVHICWIFTVRICYWNFFSPKTLCVYFLKCDIKNTCGGNVLAKMLLFTCGYYLACQQKKIISLYRDAVSIWHFRFEELKVIDIKFLHGCANPTIAFIYQVWYFQHIVFVLSIA